MAAAAATTVDDIIELLGDCDVRMWSPPDPPDGFTAAVLEHGRAMHVATFLRASEAETAGLRALHGRAQTAGDIAQVSTPMNETSRDLGDRVAQLARG